VRINYKDQIPLAEGEEPNYGISEYTPKQHKFHEDIMRLLATKRHKEIGADEIMVVFGRVYSTYALSQIKKEGKGDIFTKEGE